jgi:hypothetical protein
MAIPVLLRACAPSIRHLFGVLLVWGAVPLAARADPIVYTGPSPDGTRWTVASFQWIAGEFTIAAPHTVTGIEAWMQSYGGELRVRLYGDGGDIPGSALFSQTMNVSRSNELAWIGATNVSWLIAPGTYWAALEVPSNFGFEGAAPLFAPNPLANEAITGFSGRYRPLQLNVGWRVVGDPVGSPVPEPTTLLLFGTTLAVAGMRRWRGRRSS